MPKAGKASMVRQVQNKFQRMLSIGESKHAAKIQKYFESEEGQREFREWKQKQDQLGDA